MLTHRFRGAVVSAETTWKGHTVEVYGDFTDAQVRVINSQDQIVLELLNATVETRDGTVHRIEGVSDGVPMIVRAVKSCARCSTEAVYSTPSYDVPR